MESKMHTCMANLGRSLVRVLAIFPIFYIARANPDTTVQNIYCSPEKYSLDDPYSRAVDYVIVDLVAKTSSSGFKYLNESPRNIIKPCYGLGACSGTISPADCDTCMNFARYQLQNSCVYTVGGQVQLTDCRIRYENYPFEEV